MTQWILCEKCGKRHRETYPRLVPVDSVDGERYAGQLFPASTDGPAERGTMLRGVTRYAMVCDHCNAALDAGAAVWAVGVIADGMRAAENWEREFIDPTVDIDVPEWGTTVTVRPLRPRWNEEPPERTPEAIEADEAEQLEQELDADKALEAEGDWRDFVDESTPPWER